MENNKLTRNLGTETLIAIRESGKAPSDVLMVTQGNTFCSFDDFLEQANHIDYTANQRPPVISPSLKVIGTNWQLVRCVYNAENFWEDPAANGMEYWEFKSLVGKHMIPVDWIKILNIKVKP
jgi:hypothetical protein